MAKIYSFSTKELLADLPTDLPSPAKNFDYGTHDSGPLQGVVFIIAQDVEQARSVFRQINDLSKEQELIVQAKEDANCGY